MADSNTSDDIDYDRLAADAAELALTWVGRSVEMPVDPAAERLAGILKDPHGLEFSRGFVDGVMRPESAYVAGNNLARIAHIAPEFLPPTLRAAIRTGGVLGPVVPAAVIPVARRVLRTMVGHLVLDATPHRLDESLGALRANGTRLNLNLLGEPVLGDHEAALRLEGTRVLLERPDVDHVSLRVSAIAAQISLWAFDETVDLIVERLLPLYRLAAAAPGGPKFINLDMEEYRDLDLTIAVFTRVLDDPALRGLSAGIALQAYLPDAMEAMGRLQEWAAARVAAGGAPIRVRLVKGANLPLERVDATLHGWPSAPYLNKQDTDANYKRVLIWALTAERTRAVTLGVAGHNLFDIAFAWRLAQRRRLTTAVEFEMMLGMAPAQAEVVRQEVGAIRLYTPVVHPGEFDSAVSYLVRRLEEGALEENFLSAIFEVGTDPILFERERERFAASVRQLKTERRFLPEPRRTQNRESEWSLAEPYAPVPDAPEAPEAFTRPAADEDEVGMTEQVLGLERRNYSAGLFDSVRIFDSTTIVESAATTHGAPGFSNAPDTDPTLAANRAWARRVLARAEESELGNQTAADARVDSAETLQKILAETQRAGREWGLNPAAERSALLRRAGFSLAANRDRLLEVMVSETGKTVAESDPEISEAIDYAHYYSAISRELDSVRGARYRAPGLIVVASPWSFPVAVPAGGVLAALAAGAGVILKPAPQARRSAAVLAEALWEAGVPRELLRLVDTGEGEDTLDRALITDPRVDHVLLTGELDTAELFRSWKPELSLLAQTGGKNAIIVMPSADIDQAAADVVESAFGLAGQKRSAASLVIVVGSAARSERFRRQLVDATLTLAVGEATHPGTRVGPLIEPAAGPLLEALTVLPGNESWLLQPRRLDDAGRLWSPGIREGVQPGSDFHRTEYSGPVLGLMQAGSLKEAVRYVNMADSGLASGLHTREAGDLADWLELVQAGNLYVNRAITGAIVQRQPFGGWKSSAVGTGTKPGGPNYLVGLGSWEADTGASSSTLHLRGLDPRIRKLIEAAQPALSYQRFDQLRRAALSDAIAWGTNFGETVDAAELGVERNLLRYVPVPVAIRAGEFAELDEVLRVIIAALRAKSAFSVSLATGLPAAVRAVLGELAVPIWLETDAEWIDRFAEAEPEGRRPAASAAPVARVSRVRLVGPDRAALHARLAAAVGGDTTLAIYDGAVTPAGRVELLAYLREQVISITAHRFGAPDPWSEGVI
ncbi:proline dehydrogenase family protein [Mycetocola spongiae]|uniref:proline dehydrogenase family protein n=1 Tax=Mycetocola spongiae TaxID=2859226 RepID=UPI001CF2E010|nr:bifunctional proline dehydrogenase/L-glutamate gamma-semialdehyde dehydrogenase [Mycetocola spongiae]UCR88169.1 bifunctional proline dehydrogenase/L-glutamate gamma-semialdehyde dehydrogenase [Mycetocola spongiae]